MYTGDDFNYPDAHRGRRRRLFARAARHLRCDCAGRIAGARRARRQRPRTFNALLAPTVPLSRHIFRAPTQYYKTGVVFLAYLNGFQDHFFMLGGHHGMRPPAYLADVFRLADQAGLLRDPEMPSRACARSWRRLVAETDHDERKGTRATHRVMPIPQRRAASSRLAFFEQIRRLAEFPASRSRTSSADPTSRRKATAWTSPMAS